MLDHRSYSVAELAPFMGGGGSLRMGLSRVPVERWLDQGPLRADRLAAKVGSSDPAACTVALPESEVAQEEAMRLIARALNTDRPEGSGPPLARAAQLTFEDLCILQERDREYVLTAGTLSFPTDWRLQDKIGLSIRAVHAPVPDYEGRLADGVDYFFQALPAGPVFERANWFVVDSDALCFLPDQPPEVRFAGLSAENAGARLVVRCERQTLRRLPMTGAFLFTIGVYLCRLESLAAELVLDLSEAVLDLPEREAARRYAPFYAQALADYAKLRRAAD